MHERDDYSYGGGKSERYPYVVTLPLIKQLDTRLREANHYVVSWYIRRVPISRTPSQLAALYVALERSELYGG